MLKAALRNLFAHKLRLVLTGLSIVLAVAFVAGTYIFTDSLRASLDTLIQQDQPDVSVQPASADFSPDFQGAGKLPTVPTTLVPEIEDLDGVTMAVPAIVVPNIVVLDKQGLPLGQESDGFGGGTAIGSSWVTEPALNPTEVVEGSPPVGADQLALDSASAEQLGVVPGDEITVLLPDGDRTDFELSGVTETQNGSGFAITFVYWDFATAQDLFLTADQASSISVLADPGSVQTQIRDAISPLLPTGVVAVTGEEQASQVSEQLDSGLGFLNTFLLVFAIVSLFVAAFLIYNTFSMLVAQRTRELALLRAIGASRGQVLRSILAEAVVLALVASALGIAAGAGFAKGLQALFQAAGAPFPASSLVFEPRTIVVAMLVGLVITVVSALLPARRASVIAPVAAMREESVAAGSGHRRTAIGGFLLGGGIGLAVMAPRVAANDTMQGALVAGVAAAGVLIGVLALSPELARPATVALSALFRGVNGRLASGNTRRNPRRTAATAGALTIGVCLMSAISVLAASTQKSVAGIVDDVIGADFVITGYGFQPFPGAVGEAVRATEGVQAAAVVRQAPMRAPGTGDTLATGVDPTVIQQALSLTVPEGSFDDLGEDDVAVDRDTADSIGAGVGSTIQVLSVAGPVDLQVVAVYEPAGGFTGYVTDLPTIARLGAADQDSVVYVVKDPATSAEDVQAGLERALEPYPNVQLLDQSAFKQTISDQIGQLLNFLFALLVLAVLIALLGIVNTLALSVFERTREIGLLRAVGMSRRGIRRTIVIEAFIIAAFGAVVGMIVGVAFGALLQRILADQGIEQFAVNAGQLALFLVLAAVGGVLAALWPAWRASRLRILGAIAAE
ncbi:MAG: FtsX-like permease family protein [Candidatus Nanopelagicales bacterium]|jgi:putative ABC transport system permease protein|nr:FtsX-like permease family protein [Candidatus Nanopelagicales bacterium]